MSIFKVITNSISIVPFFNASTNKKGYIVGHCPYQKDLHNEHVIILVIVYIGCFFSVIKPC